MPAPEECTDRVERRRGFSPLTCSMKRPEPTVISSFSPNLILFLFLSLEKPLLFMTLTIDWFSCDARSKFDYFLAYDFFRADLDLDFFCFS